MTQIQVLDSNNLVKSKIENITTCKTIFSKARGLMFRKKPKILFFEFTKEINIALHMYFVFFSIDLVFLDKNMKVIEIKKNFQPWTFYTSKVKAKYVIEMPLDLIENNGIVLGDLVKMTE